jgi:hypothetical protein
MSPGREESLRADVAGLSSRVNAAQQSLEKNDDATAGLGEEVARPRCGINGTLPRIDRDVERIFDKLDEGQKLMHAARGYEVPAGGALTGDEWRNARRFESFQATSGRARPRGRPPVSPWATAPPLLRTSPGSAGISSPA